MPAGIPIWAPSPHMRGELSEAGSPLKLESTLQPLVYGCHQTLYSCALYSCRDLTSRNSSSP